MKETAIEFRVCREAAVGASRNTSRLCPFPEHMMKVMGPYPLTYDQREVALWRQFGWQHGVFSSHIYEG